MVTWLLFFPHELLLQQLAVGEEGGAYVRERYSHILFLVRAARKECGDNKLNTL